MASNDFEFITKTILGQKDDSPLLLCFSSSGIFDVESIISLSDRVIDRLKYRNSTLTPPVTEELPIGYQQLIRAFNAFVDTKVDDGDPIHGDWQNKAIKSDFDEFRMAGFAKYIPKQAPTSAMATSGGHTGGSTSLPPRVRDPVFEFKKGIKRDPNSFTVIKDNKQWDSFYRTLRAQTSYQDVDDVLDPNYKPKSTEDIELFQEKQKYMYSVFERILQTDEGKVIVRSHDADRNAQLIYGEILQVMTKSTEAMMDSSDILSYLTTTKISDGSWRGTTKAFLLNWVDKLRLFHELTPVPDRLSESVQRTLLQNAVIGLDVLRQVQISSELQKATTGTVITFAQYKSLLINAATGYDKQSGKSNQNGKPRRSAFSSEIIFGDESGLEDGILYEDVASEFCYDVDTMPGEIQAYAANQRERPQFKPGSRMPIGRWKALSEQAQKVWDTMEDDDKAKILALHETRKGDLPSAKSKFSVNTHTVTNDIPPMILTISYLPWSPSSLTERNPTVIPPMSVPFFLNLSRQPRLKLRTNRYLSMAIRMCAKSSLTKFGTLCPMLLVETKVLSSIEELMEALPVAIQGSSNAIPIERSIFVALITMRSPPFLLSRQELLSDLNEEMLLLSCTNMPTIRNKDDRFILPASWSPLPTMSMTDRFALLVAYNVLRLWMVTFFPSVFGTAYRILPCVHTRMMNLTPFHM
jgi:hypothetical protein